MDIQEDEKGFAIFVDVPVFAAGNVDVTMDESARQVADEDESPPLRHAERRRGTFLRRFTLPNTANAEKISARLDAGVLTVTIPRAAKAQPSRIVIAG